MPSAPVSDLESARYWEGLRREKLCVQRCGACERCRFPPIPACPYCGELESCVVESGGTGRLYSWVVIHRALSGEWAAEVPYAVGVVELDEGCRVLARLSPETEPTADLPMEVYYVHHEEWSEARFRPRSPLPALHGSA